EHAGRQGTIDVRPTVNVPEMFQGARAARRRERRVAHRAGRLQLFGVVPVPDTVGTHAVEHYFSRSAAHGFLHPVQRAPAQRPGTVRTARVLPDPPLPVGIPQAVHADNDTFRTELPAEFTDQAGPFQGW